MRQSATLGLGPKGLPYKWQRERFVWPTSLFFPQAQAYYSSSIAIEAVTNTDETRLTVAVDLQASMDEKSEAET